MRLPTLKEFVTSAAIFSSIGAGAATVTKGKDYWMPRQADYFAMSSVHVIPYTITVEQGDTLETIAGKIGQVAQRPVTWKQVYGQNRDKIKNPDRIYPGQQFTYLVPVDAAPDVTPHHVTHFLL